ncbi:hypothetical protein AB6A40_004792 [Gnathostoma spinigerum]|uniref:Uncharacterized protein n=1 Tax=Gnathostoma spinigerum TaxID=75299 RepID=A0ABD6EDK3_9BILA
MPLLKICCVGVPLHESSSAPYIPCNQKYFEMVSDLTPVSSSNDDEISTEFKLSNEVNRARKGLVSFNTGSAGNYTFIIRTKVTAFA